jgi:hypothetical protein
MKTIRNSHRQKLQLRVDVFESNQLQGRDSDASIARGGPSQNINGMTTGLVGRELRGTERWSKGDVA